MKENQSVWTYLFSGIFIHWIRFNWKPIIKQRKAIVTDNTERKPGFSEVNFCWVSFLPFGWTFQERRMNVGWTSHERCVTTLFPTWIRYWESTKSRPYNVVIERCGHVRPTLSQRCDNVIVLAVYAAVNRLRCCEFHLKSEDTRPDGYCNCVDNFNPLPPRIAEDSPSDVSIKILSDVRQSRITKLKEPFLASSCRK